ncbi:hypothetical protein PV08_12068 [Exophiala spinifera]|uniref:Major facilitator superfamily (MFS) profile domain-containing protein n=1 Tax=Exophiala spinifera TaxID=91928 RepID=A0A0D1Y404_9EURO|nr:uncharacterized protein PV08_12068 [Exophiala spinifera]KIW09681.1 hypothetical protein PV08_12068 [Exophiala spinifera]
MSTSKDGYLLSRNFNASSRLTAQHLLICRRTASLLDSRIAVGETGDPGRPLVIADIGCGNGIWTIELSQSSNCQVVGLDSSSELFPPDDIWPRNCTFDTFNVLAPVERKYIGVFDIINIRLLAGGLGRRDYDRVLANLKLMLREGGWLQWLDITPPYILTYAREASQTLPVSIGCEMPRVVQSLGWLGHLPDLLKETGFTRVESSRTQPQGALLKHETNNVLLALSEIRDHLRHCPDRVGGFERAFDEVCNFVVEGGLVALITRQLRGTTIYAFWTGTSYLMTSAIAQPFISTISERLGIHMRMIWFSVSAFAAGSIICALSRDFIPLLAGRSLQGLGGGGIITLVQIIFARLVPLRERPKWFSIVLTTWAVGSVVGPFLGSVLTTTSTFHWIFWINLPICGLALVVIPFTIPSFRPTAQCSWSKVDWAGGAIFFTSLTSVLLGLSWGGVTFPWTSKWTISSITLGFCGTLLFGIWEHNFPKFPIFQSSLFNTASRIALYFCSFLQGLIVSANALRKRRETETYTSYSASYTTSRSTLPLPSNELRWCRVPVFCPFHVHYYREPPSHRKSSAAQAAINGSSS